MINNIPRISVYIITYNQENVIRRTLDSVLSQKDYVYEICISDDHSTDNTWNIVIEYSNRYPGLFNISRNEQNLGIFENTEKVWEMPTGDIVYDLAGDDTVGEGWFKEVVSFIEQKKIDYPNELFCIYGDYKAIYPNGDCLTMKNDLVLRNVDLLSLSLRGLINNRGSCYSINVLKKFRKVSQGRSHVAEDAQDRQRQLFTERSYYISHVSQIYFTQIGVTTKMNDSIYKEREEKILFTKEFLEKNGYKYSKWDIRFMQHCIKVNDYLRHPSLKNKFKVILSYYANYFPSVGIRSLGLKALLFAIKRRLPHSQPINM